MTDDDPLPLKEACALYPAARLTVSTLRAESARGRLDIFRLGKRDYVTPKAMREMIRKCQDAARLPASISTESVGNGLSATDQVSSAQAALRTTVEGLKAGLPHISGKNTGRKSRHAH